MSVRCDEGGGGGSEVMSEVECIVMSKEDNGSSDGDEGDVRVGGCACMSVYDSEKQWW